MKNHPDWIVCDSNDQTVKCLRCEASESLKLPASATDFVEHMKLFEQKHLACPAFKHGDIIVPAKEKYPTMALRVVELHPDGRLTAAPEGGGFEMTFGPDGVKRYAFRVVSKEELLPVYRVGMFQLDDIWPDHSFEGYTSGRRWNGWACPVFEKDVAMLLVKALQKEHSKKEYARYNKETDTFEIWDEGEEEHVLYPPVEITVGEKKRKVYEIGTAFWTWSELEKEAADAHKS